MENSNSDLPSIDIIGLCETYDEEGYKEMREKAAQELKVIPGVTISGAAKELSVKVTVKEHKVLLGHLKSNIERQAEPRARWGRIRRRADPMNRFESVG